MFKPSWEFDLIFMLDGLEFPNSINQIPSILLVEIEFSFVWSIMG
jgi:hypothetical protein